MEKTNEQLNLDKLWKNYQKGRENGNGQFYRNKLIEHYRFLTKAIAEKVYHNVPNYLELDDLIAYGVFGLIDAIEKFDIKREIKFETYSDPRIRGSILDVIREMDWTPQTIISRVKQLKKANKKLESELNRSLTYKDDKELIKELSDDKLYPSNAVSPSRPFKLKGKEKAELILKDVRNAKKIEQFPHLKNEHGEDDMFEVKYLESPEKLNPSFEAEKKELKEVLTKGLTRTEKLIITLYYYENMTMKEIGEIIGLTGGRVSQTHLSIISRLKYQLTDNRKSSLEDTLISCINHQQI